MTQSESRTWECIGVNQGPAFLGTWQASAFVAEGPLGWYAAAEGHKTGPEFVYRLPGRLSPSGPHTRSAAEGIARQMIGLTTDASCPAPDQLVLFLGLALEGNRENEGQDVTGGHWELASSGDKRSCIICNEVITAGWAEGPWKHARRFICAAHVEARLEARPIQQGLPASTRGPRGRRLPGALKQGAVATPDPAIPDA